MITKDSKIYIAGHKGMVGSAIYRKFKQEGYKNILVKTRDELDLKDQKAVSDFFSKEKPEYVFIAAAKVGGIVANNTYRADFLYENLMIQNNIIHNCYLNNVKKLIFLGSSCIYPKMAKQPIKEESLLSDYLEQTNEPYAIAKITGLKLCENYYRQYGCNFFSLMPCNLYGPYDNFDLIKSHVLSALLRKMHLGKCLEKSDWDSIKTDLNFRPIEGITGDDPKDDIIEAFKKSGIHFNNSEVTIDVWGTGRIKREFMYVEDLADALFYLAQKYNLPGTNTVNDFNKISYFFNVGSGEDITINDLAQLIKKTTGFSGKLQHDLTKPDGTPRKLLDVTRLKKAGWVYKTNLNKGIKEMYKWYLKYSHE